jgi:hypothetical protein
VVESRFIHLWNELIILLIELSVFLNIVSSTTHEYLNIFDFFRYLFCEYIRIVPCIMCSIRGKRIFIFSRSIRSGVIVPRNSTNLYECVTTIYIPSFMRFLYYNE